MPLAVRPISIGAAVEYIGPEEHPKGKALGENVVFHYRPHV